MDTNTRTTDAAVVADIAARNVLLGSQPKAIQRTEPTGKPFVVLLDERGAQRVTALGEYDPPRKKARVLVHETTALIEYVVLYADPSSRLFCEVEKRSFTAILDYHDAATPDAIGRRGEHVALLQLKLTPTIEAWMKLAEKAVPQAVLAEFLEDRYRDILEPDGAEILELAKTLEVTNDVAFKSVQRSSDGGYDLNYTETVATRAGQNGQITVPTRFLLGVQVFQGGPTVEVPMRMRFRLSGGAVQFVITFLGLEDLIRGEVVRVRDEIAAATNRPVWAGSANIG